MTDCSRSSTCLWHPWLCHSFGAEANPRPPNSPKATKVEGSNPGSDDDGWKHAQACESVPEQFSDIGLVRQNTPEPVTLQLLPGARVLVCCRATALGSLFLTTTGALFSAFHILDYTGVGHLAVEEVMVGLLAVNTLLMAPDKLSDEDIDAIATNVSTGGDRRIDYEQFMSSFLLDGHTAYKLYSCTNPNCYRCGRGSGVGGKTLVIRPGADSGIGTECQTWHNPRSRPLITKGPSISLTTRCRLSSLRTAP